jgi:hypothetical protein
MALIRPTSLWTRRLIVPNLGTVPSPLGLQIVAVEDRYVPFIVDQGYGTVVIESEQFNPIIEIPPLLPVVASNPAADTDELVQDDSLVTEVTHEDEIVPLVTLREGEGQGEGQGEEPPPVPDTPDASDSVDEPWAVDALNFLNSKTPVVIANQIAGIGPKKASELVAARPLTWDAVKHSLTASQLTALESKFSETNS